MENTKSTCNTHHQRPKERWFRRGPASATQRRRAADLYTKTRTQADANKTQTNYTNTEKPGKRENKRQAANARRSFEAEKSTAGKATQAADNGQLSCTQRPWLRRTRAHTEQTKVKRPKSGQRLGQSQNIDPDKGRRRAEGQAVNNERTKRGLKRNRNSHEEVLTSKDFKREEIISFKNWEGVLEIQIWKEKAVISSHRMEAFHPSCYLSG